MALLEIEPLRLLIFLIGLIAFAGTAPAPAPKP